MTQRLSAFEVARRRVIDRIDLSKGKGEIVVTGVRYQIRFDDVLDLVRAVEMIMLKQTGKVIRSGLRPEITDRKALQHSALQAGDYSLYDGNDGPEPLEHTHVCDVTHILLTTHYLRVEIDGNRWDQWFCRLDELVKCLYIIVREAQGDPFVPRVGVAGAVSQAFH